MIMFLQKRVFGFLWRFFLPLGLFLVGLQMSMLSTASQAEASYPQRPINLVVTFPPGGGTDLLARKLAEALDEYLPIPIVVENRPGASGNIGARYVAQSKPDGYTLLMVNSSYAINPSFYAGLGFDPDKDLRPVANLAWVPSVWVHTKKSAINDVNGALQQSGEPEQKALLYGSCGQGTPQHLAAEMLRQQTGLALQHVPYKGCGPALNDVLAGHVPSAFITLSSASPYIDRGDLHALAVTSAQRSHTHSEIPTLQEALAAPYDVAQWHAVFAPAHTPQAIIEQLRAQIKKVLAQESMQADLQALGYELSTETDSEFEQMVRDDLQRYRSIARQMQIKE